ncbi:antitoxin [Streptomyces sp. NPDC046805]|uniref:antitoxin n=1 Tax=Streptomyces sp. NPDC046805 TaxID=3155134 RepID=UPI0034047492
MSIKDKIKDLLKGHEQQADRGIDQAGDRIDEKTQGQHQSQVDTAQQRMKDELGGQDRDIPPHP